MYIAMYAEVHEDSVASRILASILRPRTTVGRGQRGRDHASRAGGPPAQGINSRTDSPSWDGSIGLGSAGDGAGRCGQSNSHFIECCCWYKRVHKRRAPLRCCPSERHDPPRICRPNGRGRVASAASASAALLDGGRCRGRCPLSPAPTRCRRHPLPSHVTPVVDNSFFSRAGSCEFFTHPATDALSRCLLPPSPFQAVSYSVIWRRGPRGPRGPAARVPH